MRRLVQVISGFLLLTGLVLTSPGYAFEDFDDFVDINDTAGDGVTQLTLFASGDDPSCVRVRNDDGSLRLGTGLMLLFGCVVNDVVNITSEGNVGIATIQPIAPLHVSTVSSATSNAQLLVDNIDQATVEPRSMLELINNGPIGFNMENIDTGQRWRFAAQTTGFRISLDGTGGPEFEVRDNSNAVLAGNLFTNSDVNAKQDIVQIEDQSILQKLEALPVSEWSYKDATDIRHLGPMAQDFRAAFGLGQDDTSIAPMDLAGVSLAAVKAMREQQKRNQTLIDDLRAELKAQRELIATLLEQMGDRSL